MKNMGIVAVLGVAAAGLWAIGCTTSSLVGNGGGGSCDLTATAHECYTYSAAENVCELGVCAGQTGCTDSGGKWGASCPPGMLGTCSPASNSGYSTTYYGTAGITAMSAQMSCTESGGTWAAGK